MNFFKQKGIGTSFGNKRPISNIASLLSNMETNDLYEGGRTSKRKRDFDDDESDDDVGGKLRDPSAYNSAIAKIRTNLIRTELNKRRHGIEDSPKAHLTDEEIKRAKETKLLDPLNSKISNLSLKSRENWFNKMCQVMQENFDLFSSNLENSETKKYELCVKFEYEILMNSKNLSIYQAKCMTKYKEIRNLTVAKISFLKDYMNKQAGSVIVDDCNAFNDIQNSSLNENSFKDLKISGFQSASSLIPGELVKKPVLKNISTVFTMPRIEKKTSSVFEEIEKLKVEDQPIIKPYDNLLNDYTATPEAERIRNARLLKFESIKTENNSEINQKSDVKEPLEAEIKKPGVDTKLESSNNKAIDLPAISGMVVLELTPYYKSKKFANKVKLDYKNIIHI